MWLKQIKLWKISAVLGGIVVFGALMCIASLHVQIVKASQMNVQCNLNWELMLSEFELSCDVLEATQNICYAKGEVDHSTVPIWFKKFCSGYKNLNDQAR